MVLPFTNSHVRQVEHVVRMLAGMTAGVTAEQVTEAIVGAYLLFGTRVDGCTIHGTTGQRYEAVVALRRPVDDRTGRPVGAPRYLVDVERVGEYVIPVGAFADQARRELGSISHGLLDARMEEVGWRRVRLEGHDTTSGRRGHHARADAYVGELAEEQLPEELST
jgi:hypothetical protein